MMREHARKRPHKPLNEVCPRCHIGRVHPRVLHSLGCQFVGWGRIRCLPHRFPATLSLVAKIHNPLGDLRPLGEQPSDNLCVFRAVRALSA